MDLVSVIVPVYRVEDYLDRCVQSIVDQTYRNLEIILVDDGSPDNCGAMCDVWATKDSRIKVIHKENGGVSSARNAALDCIQGKYVFFVDSDDYILPRYVEHFMDFGECDYIAGGYHVDSPTGKCKGFEQLRTTFSAFREDCAFAWEKIPTVWLCGNRYAADIINEHCLRFDVQCKCGEDTRFNFCYLPFTDTLAVSNQCEYIYYQRADSAVHKFWPDRLEKERKECQQKATVFVNSPTFNYMKYIHWHITLEHFFVHSSVCPKKLFRSAIKDRYFRACIPYVLANGTLDMKIEVVCLFFGSYRLYKAIFGLVSKL